MKERLVYIESASNLLSEQKTCLNNPLNNIEAHIARKVNAGLWCGVVDGEWESSTKYILQRYINNNNNDSTLQSHPGCGLVVCSFRSSHFPRVQADKSRFPVEIHISCTSVENFLCGTEDKHPVLYYAVIICWTVLYRPVQPPHNNRWLHSSRWHWLNCCWDLRVFN